MLRRQKWSKELNVKGRKSIIEIMVKKNRQKTPHMDAQLALTWKTYFGSGCPPPLRAEWPIGRLEEKHSVHLLKNISPATTRWKASWPSEEMKTNTYR
mmetsp:Transcript_27099/g.43411  ORF Transcript_27099/g.43411 Transcript_27099/m.43411 type:complete len:98 (-) Transcript_27099:57-350(-)